MNTPEPQFSVNDRVRLRDGVDPGFYNGYSRTGNEGWVRKYKFDKYGYSQILLEWDKNHWSYNGAPDSWTWEGHFEPVEDDMSNQRNQEDAIREVTDGFVKGLLHIFQPEADLPESEEPDAEPVKESGLSTEEEDWVVRIGAAQEVLNNARAFVTVALCAKEDDAEAPLQPYILMGAQDEKLGLICQSQVSHLSLMFQDSLIGEEVNRLSANKEA